MIQTFSMHLNTLFVYKPTDKLQCDAVGGIYHHPMLISILIISPFQIDNMKVLLVLVGVIAAASAVSFFDLVHEEWELFKVSNLFVE